MMQIELCLNVATVDFLRSIAGKEIVLDTEIDKHNMVHLLIYPKESIYVGAIDDIFDNCNYDVAGVFHGEIGFDEDNAFKYEIGLQLQDSAPFVANNDLMFELINKALIHNGIIDAANEDTIIFNSDCFYGIKNTCAIITINEDDMVAIETVEIIED